MAYPEQSTEGNAKGRPAASATQPERISPSDPGSRS